MLLPVLEPDPLSALVPLLELDPPELEPVALVTAVDAFA